VLAQIPSRAELVGVGLVVAAVAVHRDAGARRWYRESAERRGRAHHR
jgi:hypothetical protein